MWDVKTQGTVVRAMAVAAADPEARIAHMSGNAVSAASCWKYAIRNKIEDFTYNMQTREATHKNGGKVLFRHADRDLYEYSGMQVSHMWVDELVGVEARKYLRCRVRSAKKHSHPIGMYDYNGAVKSL